MGAKENYQIVSSDINALVVSLNFVLNSISTRLDQIEGNKGNPTFRNDLVLEGNKVTDAGAGTASSDAVVLSQVPSDDDAPTYESLNVINNVNGKNILSTEGKFAYYDENGMMIHGFGDI